jgi:hypothetical protein
MKSLWILIFLLCSGLFIVACKTTSPTSPAVADSGTPTALGTLTGSPSTATIDATGGSLISADGRLELIIPPDALATATPISIQSGTNEAPLGSGAAYSLTPNGQQFNKPVTVRFHYTDDDRAGTDLNVLTVASQKDDRIWYAFKSVTLDSVTKTLSVQTTHFSWYTVLEWFKISPLESEINVGATQALKVMLLPIAPVDNDPTDDNSPLNSANVYSNADQVSWSINGNAPADPNDGSVTPQSGSSTTTYTAPSSTTNMNGNPVAVTATVSLPGNNQFFSTPHKLYLTSNIKVLGGPKVSGRITLSATVSGSKTNDFSSQTDVKSEVGSGDFVYQITNAPIEDAGGMRFASWNDAAFGGTADWVSVHTLSYNYICDANKDRIITDKTTTTQTFSSASSGAQITGIGLQIDADGNYQIAIGPSVNNAANSTTLKEYSGYCTNPAPETYGGASPIPFTQYFLPYVAGGGDKTNGKIDPAHPNSIKGSYHGTDQLTMFSSGTNTITLPLEYTITWDLTITN